MNKIRAEETPEHQGQDEIRQDDASEHGQLANPHRSNGKRKLRWKHVVIGTVSLALLFVFLNVTGIVCIHKWTPANCSHPKTCHKCGLEEGEPNPEAHGWNEANCVSPKTCAYCKKTEGEPNPNNHLWSDTSDQGYMICKRCGKVTGDTSAAPESQADESSDFSPTSEGDSLFGSEDYEGALQCYKSLESGDGYKAIFEHGVELFEKGEYGQCRAYMDVAKESSAVDSDAAEKYVQTCYALTDAKNDMAMLYRTDQLKRMDAEGFEPASRALKNDAFAPYRKLSDAAGLYRSDDVIEHYDIVPESNIMLGEPYEVYSYIAIGSQLYSTVLAADGAKITMTLEKAQERSRNNDFDCDIHAVGDDRFHCKATYTDAVTKKGYDMEFDIVPGDGFLSVENLSTNEGTGNETLHEGKYSKIS